MEILPPEVTEFLATVELSDSANAFLASNTCDLASKYEEWRRNTGKPELANSAKGVVYSWKQDVTRKQRENIRQEVEAASKAKKIKKVSSTGSTKTPPSARREALAAKKQSISSPTIVGNTTNSAPASTTTTTSIIAPKSILSNTGTKKELSRDSHDPSPCMDSNKSGDNNESANSSELIFTPHNHDVLSGRGGATNQHVGNTWYRRLVRCSAGFYKTCPKHTKLLVAKAVVSAIQKQNPPGRFLELSDRSTGAFREMSYKRAVDKASQALRERWDANPVDGASQATMTRLFNSIVNPDRCGNVSRDAVANAVDLAIWRVAIEAASAKDNDCGVDDVGIRDFSKRPVRKPSNSAPEKISSPKSSTGMMPLENRLFSPVGHSVVGVSTTTDVSGSGDNNGSGRKEDSPRPKALAAEASKIALVRKVTVASMQEKSEVFPRAARGRDDSFGSPVPSNYVRPGTNEPKAVDQAVATSSSFIDFPSSFDTATITSLSPSFDAATESNLSPSFETAASLSSDTYDNVYHGVKRKPVTIVGQSKENDSAATKGKRSRNDSGISPFHREILKMNLQRIID